MVERKVTMQKASDAVQPVLKGKFTWDIDYARPCCIVRCTSSTYARRVAALDLVPTSSLQRHRSKSAPGTSGDFDTIGGRVKNIPRIVNTGKTSGPGKALFPVQLIEVLAWKICFVDGRAYLKQLAGLDDSSSEGSSNDSSADCESMEKKESKPSTSTVTRQRSKSSSPARKRHSTEKFGLERKWCYVRMIKLKSCLVKRFRCYSFKEVFVEVG